MQSGVKSTLYANEHSCIPPVLVQCAVYCCECVRTKYKLHLPVRGKKRERILLHARYIIRTYLRLLLNQGYSVHRKEEDNLSRGLGGVFWGLGQLLPQLSSN